MANKGDAPGIPAVWLSGDEDSSPLAQDTSSAWRSLQRSNLWRPPTDVYETDEAFVVLVEVAGMRGLEFSVSLEKQTLSIRGVRGDTSAMKAYHQMEIAYGQFETAVRIPVAVEATEIEATYGDGFLRVVLPKARPKRIAIT
jgi:HSP20 family protein